MEEYINYYNIKRI
ncbi:MAG: hypothetical protein KHW41_02145 [Veillonella sp.]|nr:hypothetical protein [Veillonella sp.]MTG96034.1 hypothetical protein [Veillonella dispar]MTH31644.1 hypothetical protein [Veillonella dispar]MTH37694.1 hypothetical protein [Veillonella dispar]RYS56278.1 hypothetical protein EAI97_06630 [Veillonella dispar]